MPLSHPVTRILLVLVACAIPAISAPARAAVSPPGVNIRWDNCYDDGGSANRVFACDTNSGSEQLVCSFVLASPMSDVSGNEIVVDIVAGSAGLPAWWALRNIGSCRQTSLTQSLTPPAGSVNCTDWAGGFASGGIGAYNLGFFGPNSARIVAATAVPASNLASLAANVEYFSMSFLINHAKTVGTGACAGCNVPVCILFQSLNLVTPVSANNRKLYTGANYQGSQIALWQNAYATGVSLNCPNNRPCETTFGCTTYDPTGTHGSTWGAVKALYR
jgi:hypothetical protein